MLTDRMALWQEAFGDPPEFTELFFKLGFSQKRHIHVEKDGQLAGALYWFDCLWQGKKLAYIYGVAVSEPFRGQGLSHQLMEKAHNHLRETGYHGAVLVPAEESLFSISASTCVRPRCRAIQNMTEQLTTAPMKV